MLARTDEESSALVAFYGERLEQPQQKQKKKFKPKKGSNKNINFRSSDNFTQEGLLESWKVEWEKWGVMSSNTIRTFAEWRLMQVGLGVESDQ